jgi:hypothetical protein
MIQFDLVSCVGHFLLDYGQTSERDATHTHNAHTLQLDHKENGIVVSGEDHEILWVRMIPLPLLLRHRHPCFMMSWDQQQLG